MARNQTRKNRQLLRTARETSRILVGNATSEGKLRKDLDPAGLQKATPGEILRWAKIQGSFTNQMAWIKRTRLSDGMTGPRVKTTRTQPKPITRKEILALARDLRKYHFMRHLRFLPAKESYRMALEVVRRLGYEPAGEKTQPKKPPAK